MCKEQKDGINMDRNIVVSIIIPVLNEERYIAQCIDSILQQTYPTEKIEVLIIDGNSTDNTRAIVEKYSNHFPEIIKIISNEKRIQSCAMNIGIKEAKGKYIIRLDAHADYADNYIEECVKLLDTNEYENVGGIAITKSKTPFGEVVAQMMSSTFGVGNSTFRTANKSGEVDTVPFGAFKRDLFDKIGGFDERLARNEDNEINYRIRKKGGKVYLSNTIQFVYYCRDSLRDILKMAFQNGKWTIIASRFCPGSMRLRHFVPLAFALSIIVGLILSPLFKPVAFLFGAELLLYCILDFYFSQKSSKSRKQLLTLLYLFPAFHFTYGIGSIAGFFKLPTVR